MDALGDRIFGLEGNDYPGETEDRVGGVLGYRWASGISSEVKGETVFPYIAS